MDFAGKYVNAKFCCLKEGSGLRKSIQMIKLQMYFWTCIDVQDPASFEFRFAKNWTLSIPVIWYVLQVPVLSLMFNEFPTFSVQYLLIEIVLK